MLLMQSRCPKCTLLPPCKHYEKIEDMIADAAHFVAKPMFRENLSPKKREIIYRTLREQKHEIEQGTFRLHYSSMIQQ